MRLGEWKLFNLSSRCAKFDPHSSCGSEYISFLFCHMASREYMMEGTCYLLSGSPYVNTVSCL